MVRLILMLLPLKFSIALKTSKVATETPSFKVGEFFYAWHGIDLGGESALRTVTTGIGV